MKTRTHRLLLLMISSLPILLALAACEDRRDRDRQPPPANPPGVHAEP